MFNSIKLVTSVVVAVGFVTLTFDAFAYSRLECKGGHAVKRASDSVTIRIAASVANDYPEWLSTIEEAIDDADENPSDFRFLRTSGDTNVGIDNGQNEIWITSEDIGAPATTYKQITCGVLSKHRLKESDIVIAANGANWTKSKSMSSLNAFGGHYRPLKATILHELGHVAGLGHTSNNYSIMGMDYSHLHVRSSSAYPYFGADANKGLIDIYGSHGTNFDIAVSNFKYAGSHSNGYANHKKTQIYGSPFSYVDSYGFQGAYVVNGAAVEAEFTIENLGNVNFESINAALYLSTNRVISKSDRLLARKIVYNQGPGAVWTHKFSARLPTDLLPDREYYLGILMDQDNLVNESKENNNYTYLPLRLL